jgi:hypothetical protein
MIIPSKSHIYIPEQSEFVFMVNGLTDKGYPITNGSFGSVLRDTNGPIQAPDGLGMPYFSRRNFIGDVQFIYEEFKKIFNSGNWTIDFWYRFWGGSSNAYNWDIFRAGNNNRDIARISSIGAGSESGSWMYAYFVSVRYFSDNWTHVAFVSDMSAGKGKIYVNGNFAKQENIDLQTYNDAYKIIFPAYTDYQIQYGGNLQCHISQVAFRSYPVWTENFIPPTTLY